MNGHVRRNTHHANITTIASLAIVVMLMGMFSKMMRSVLLVALVGLVFSAVQSDAALEQGAAMLGSLSDQIREQLGNVIDLDAAIAVIREMLERVTG